MSLTGIGLKSKPKTCKRMVPGLGLGLYGGFVLGLALSYDSAASPLSGTKSSLAIKLGGFIITWLRLGFRV